MAGHVPKFGASNAGNFTEVFTLARTGGRAGSGDSAASQEDPRLQNPRAAPGGRATGVPPRRGSGGSGGSGSFEKEIPEPPVRRQSGAHEREAGSNRSSQDGGILGSSRPSPPARPEQRDQSGRGGRGGSQDSSSRGGRKPRNINEEYAGASHLPKFGDWNTGDAGEANYTVMFTAASKERQTGSAGDLPGKSAGRGSGDSTPYGLPKKQSPSWWCFS